MQNRINDEYFEWLYGLVCGQRYSKHISYERLLRRLHGTRFRYLIPRDRSRAEDGIDLRRRFAIARGYEDPDDTIMDILSGPCSVLEMMVALAIRCEECIMDDPDVGDRTGQWFWEMVTNLGLGAMMDSRFDKRFVDNTIARFLAREYEPDGRGNLFRIRHCDKDLRTVEIWYQLCWYLDSIT